MAYFCIWSRAREVTELYQSSRMTSKAPMAIQWVQMAFFEEDNVAPVAVLVIAMLCSTRPCQIKERQAENSGMTTLMFQSLKMSWYYPSSFTITYTFFLLLLLSYPMKVLRYIRESSIAASRRLNNIRLANTEDMAVEYPMVTSSSSNLMPHE